MSRYTLDLHAEIAFCEYLQDIVNKEELKVCLICVYQLILSDTHMSLDMYATMISQENKIDLSDALVQFKTTEQYISLVHKYSSVLYKTTDEYIQMNASVPVNIVNIYTFCNYMRLSNLGDNIINYMYNKLYELKSSPIELDEFIIEIETKFNISLVDFSKQYLNFKQLNSMMDLGISNKIKEKYIKPLSLSPKSSLCPYAKEFVPKEFVPK